MKKCGEDQDKLCALTDNIADHYQVRIIILHPNTQQKHLLHSFVCLFPYLCLYKYSFILILLLVIIIFVCFLSLLLHEVSMDDVMSPPHTPATLCP